MFGFFKNKHEVKVPLQNWRIPVADEYRKIVNEDSIQFVNADESICLYFSVLIVSGNSLFSQDVFTSKAPSVNRVANGWAFKATKSGGKELLVCVFCFINDSDEALMRKLYEEIVYTGK
ncbi:MAG: hypothetical protein J7497_17380 [Chitinophagaceae bacterium]|nr:hypothetical protein [Chitinophagaceae bacterium]